jgi:hypothetical protein
MQESKPETPSTQVSRPSPKVGVTIAILELGLVNPKNAISCAPVLVFPQPLPAKTSQVFHLPFGVF